MLDPVKFTQELIQKNTVNPPGNEKIIADYIRSIFASLPVDIIEHEFD